MGQRRDYSGQYVIITGGASGLGLALTRLFAADGAHVLVVDLHEQAPPGVLPDGVLYRRLDVTDEEGWDELRNWVEATWGRLDVLVSNAGIAVGGRIDVNSTEDWERIIGINVLGVVKGIRAFVPMMKEQGSGQLVQTASLAGLVHAAGMSAYNVVKAGVVALSETLLHELSPYGIGVSVICPSFFRTNLADSLAGKDVEMEEAAVDLITKAPRSPEQVAAVAYAGMRKSKYLILTDQDGHAAYHAKRLAKPLFDKALTQSGAELRKGGTGVSSMVKLREWQAKRSR